jgi:hypothetical protein
MNGEKVKSRGEKLLADYFFQNKISYQYERAAWTNTTKKKNKLNNSAERRKRMISKPDFYLPDYNVYVEYWGMVNTEDERSRADYLRSMKWKMAKYNENDIRFVSIYPTNLNDLDRVFPTRLREAAAGKIDLGVDKGGNYDNDDDDGDDNGDLGAFTNSKL